MGYEISVAAQCDALRLAAGIGAIPGRYTPAEASSNQERHPQVTEPISMCVCYIMPQFAVRRESFLLVEILRDLHWEGQGTGLKFVFRIVEKGTAWDGTLLLRNRERHETHILPWPAAFTG